GIARPGSRQTRLSRGRATKRHRRRLPPKAPAVLAPCAHADAGAGPRHGLALAGQQALRSSLEALRLAGVPGPALRLGLAAQLLYLSAQPLRLGLAARRLHLRRVGVRAVVV